MPVRPPVRPVTLVLNLTILACYALLAYADSLRRRPFLGIFGTGFPSRCCCSPTGKWVGSLSLQRATRWKPAGWCGTATSWAEADAQPSSCWVRWCPSLLEIAYSLVYVLGPFSVAMLYVYRRRERVDRFLFVFTLGVLLCYAQFPFWPSEPPRTVFPGQDFPSYDTVFRRFNWWMLGGYGIHTSVFPSAHVAGAFSAALGMWIALPERRWVARFLFVMAVLIATATVYGRYHYLADAAAGLVMAVLALVLTRALAIYRKQV